MIDDNKNSSLEKLLADTDVTLSALRKSHDAAIRLHRAYNAPMAIYKNGKVVELSPFDLQTEDEKQQDVSHRSQ